MEGASLSISKRMAEVGASVLTEDNLLLITCEHGIRHPVARLDPMLRFDPTEKEILARHEVCAGDYHHAKCDGCCEAGAAALEVEREITARELAATEA